MTKKNQKTKTLQIYFLGEFMLRRLQENIQHDLSGAWVGEHSCALDSEKDLCKKQGYIC